MGVVVRTGDQAAGDRLALWRELVAAGPVPVRVSATGPFHGELTSERLGVAESAVDVASVRSSASTVSRTPKLIAAGGAQRLLVGVVAQGSAVLRQDGRQTELRVGELACYDTGRPYTLVCDNDFRLFEFNLPHRLAGLTPAAAQPLTATRFDGSTGIGALAVPFLTGLAQRAAEYAAGDQGDRLVDTAGGLLTALFADRAQASTPGQAMLARALAYIDAHLTEPELGPERVAAAQHISVRYLHKLFADAHDDTVAGWIRRRRLAGAARELTARGNHTVAAIGARWGFPDAAHFNRTFRAAYGHPPGEYRNR